MTSGILFNNDIESRYGSVVAFPINRDGEAAMGNHIDTLTHDHLLAVLNYDRRTGVFTWSERPWKNSRRRAGQQAGTDKIINGSLVRYIGIGGRGYIASRLAWFYVNAEWPKRRLTFKDGNTLNVAIDNMVEMPGLDSDYDFSTAEGRNSYTRAHRAAHPDLYKHKHLVREFGLTLDEYRAKSAAQGHACAICGKPETQTRLGKVKRLAVDHDHVTGALRDLLCVECNQGIGKFADDPVRLRAAAAYIERHRATKAEEAA